MRLPHLLASALLVFHLTACPGEEPAPEDAGTTPDAGEVDAGTLTYFSSNDPVLSKAIASYENLATGFDEVAPEALELRAQTLGKVATVLTGLASGSDAGLIGYSTTKPYGADVIYDAVTRTFTATEAPTVLEALGQEGFLPTALHDFGDGTLMLVATSVRTTGLVYELTFRQVEPPFSALDATLTELSTDGFAAVASSMGERLSIIGARVSGSTVSYEHRSTVGSQNPDAGLPMPGSAISAFGPQGYIVSSVLSRGETLYVIGARQAGEMPTRINTPRIVVTHAAPLESTEFGVDSILFFDVESVDGGYLMLGTR